MVTEFSFLVNEIKAHGGNFPRYNQRKITTIPHLKKDNLRFLQTYFETSKWESCNEQEVQRGR